MSTKQHEVPEAFIEEIPFDSVNISRFANKKELEKKYQGPVVQYFLNYPAVYILHHSTRRSSYYVYVGESSNVDRRLAEHYKAKEKLVDEK
ncbi:GIY-YIG nuclease family protein [uncultured Corynebacterium sp.]|uniref:GIY-YIG nuclease family protein n=1 Tax=uncultured Corynebacterium sp. TaxID=159447 RepID=UPI00288BA758|nr:GIY-YIG nuclease family protein [uncultured Corynebacterium sp.]